MGASGPCSFKSTSAVVHIIASDGDVSLTLATLCIRRTSRDVRCDTHEHLRHLVPSRPFTRGNVLCVGGKFDHQVSRVHRATIPLQPEAHLLLPNAIFRQSIGPQIVPLLTHPLAAFTY
jgi:hypothetical protein